jgi:hypothetical protein
MPAIAVAISRERMMPQRKRAPDNTAERFVSRSASVACTPREEFQQRKKLLISSEIPVDRARAGRTVAPIAADFAEGFVG